LVLVERKPGALAGVSSLVSRRQFPIHSPAVGPTENPELYRMTIVVAVDALPPEHVGHRAEDRGTPAGGVRVAGAVLDRRPMTVGAFRRSSQLVALLV